MIKNKPYYFSEIKKAASERWDLLEKYPDLAAPWRQLFKQIQSPRHVISELLQNADDVGAKWVSVSIVDNFFIFKHNGEDFNQENFLSLCRFGYSNKRILHTIGFRGIGFKSTFSLGQKVEVTTPTLSVYFDKHRFTEPVWIESDINQNDSCTTIKVKFEEEKVKEFLKENINKWIENPLPLLFFANINELQFENRKISRRKLGNGPVENSFWVELCSRDKQRLLLISSKAESVPENAEKEIRDERGDEEFSVPPCKVEIILGLKKQQLYDVLPTNINFTLPFSANAPFIQDPARTGIKDPISSAMNQWLLERIGSLAAQTFINWLENSKLSYIERERSYAIIPANENLSSNSIIGECQSIVIENFRLAINGKSLILTSSGELEEIHNCLDIDSELFDIWSDHQILEIFGKGEKSVIAKEISKTHKKLLNSWSLLNLTQPIGILNRLTKDPLPPNPGINKINKLWEYLDKHMSDWPFKYSLKKELRIVPVKGKTLLYPSKLVNVLSAKEKKLTEEEYEFLEAHLIIIDPLFMKNVKKHQNNIKINNHEIMSISLIIVQLFSDLGLNQGVTNESLIKQASDSIFSNSNPSEKGIRFAHIVSRLDIPVPDGFKYLTQSGKWLDVSQGVLMPNEIFLEILYPKEILDNYLLNSVYEFCVDDNQKNNWIMWSQSDKSRLRKFLFPKKEPEYIYNREKIGKFCLERGVPIPSFHYTNSDFKIIDYDFDDNLWKHWKSLQETDENTWTYLVYQIASDWKNDWDTVSYAKIIQKKGSYNRNLNPGQIYSSWIEKLKSLKCIPDIYSTPRLPSELLRNTTETSPLLQIESFVHPNYDKQNFIPLLIRLGVRSNPTDANKILDRIRTISNNDMNEILFLEVAKLYDALDRVSMRLVKEQIDNIIHIFKTEKLLVSSNLSWHQSTAIFQYNPDGIPGIPIINEVLVSLNLWDRLEVLRRPSIRDAINWLNQLDNDIRLSKEDLERTRAIIQIYPLKVWEECKCWLSLEGKWRACSEFIFGSESLKQDFFLYKWVEKTTADISMLENPSQLTRYGNLKRLEESLEYRPTDPKISKYVLNPDWITAIAANLKLIKMDSNKDNLNLINLTENANRLSNTRYFVVNNLDVTPYIEGEPAGFHCKVQVLWHGIFLYILDTDKTNHREMVKAVSSVFSDNSIREAIKDCIGREKIWIDDYFQTYFILDDKPESDRPDLEKKPGSPIVEQKTDPEPEIDGKRKLIVFSDENEEEEEEEEEKEEEKEPKFPQKRKQVLQREEKFALFIQTDDYQWDAIIKQFVNDNNHRIIYVDSPFPWVNYNENGNEIRRYRLEEGSLNDGLIIRSDVYDLLKQFPDSYCLVIYDENNYQRIFWRDLVHFLKNNLLRIVPASYFIRKTDEDIILDLNL